MFFPGLERGDQSAADDSDPSETVDPCRQIRIPQNLAKHPRLRQKLFKNRRQRLTKADVREKAINRVNTCPIPKAVR
jgi:hypothetical protein